MRAPSTTRRGLGTTATLQQRAEPDEDLTREISIATGKAAYPFLTSLAERFREKYPNVTIHVYEIENKYFGENITVAGLLTGKDLSEQLSGKPLGETLYISANTLRHEGDLFLCGMSIDELSETLGTNIEPCVTDGYELFDKLCGI